MKRLDYHFFYPAHASTLGADMCHAIDALARDALTAEAALEHKPGLVCPSSNNSHPDMDFALFCRSIDALTGYFADMVWFGYAQVDFESIRQRAIQAETLMLQATGGINTHRGAIFNLGFMCLAIGRLLAQDEPLSADNICTAIITHWQYDLLHTLPRKADSHGQQMRQAYGISGAIEEVASGFMSIRRHALPCLQHAKALMSGDASAEQAHLQTLLTLIAHISDSNIVWRGGMARLQQAQALAQDFLRMGGMYQPDAYAALQRIRDYFSEQGLSAGGSADLLGATIFLDKVVHDEYRSYL
ncbi:MULTISPECIES: triphosphoribosyl-dephospho-CoA synthase MdcB [Moraxella]|uniref:triphosphoribosyl-dephospho-CoA synthase n=1 Tax=Moraxella catarrhalis TaxID=480 RepID=A0A7Z1A4P3_MORCA|nr:triphosphoribosyl-dephospho-CoA synthase MdcB [Moraxella catarrhalis]OAV01595.1 Triphosphoribosyl-dephospho-CoA synthetase [Moraxella catarrhalis]STY82672.1 triphosphoribosyl-dephospho-CoA synthase [Moraxella catarrhalis]